MGFTFNGERRDYITVLQGRRRPAWAPRTLNWIDVPGMAGAHLESVDVSTRPYDVPIRIKANSNEDLQKLKEDLAEWLLHDELKELIFDDEPDRTYFAIVDGTLDLEEIVRVGKGVITFVCDPYKYGPEKEAVFPSDTVSLNYEGTAPGDPIFEMEATQPVTFAMIQNQETNEYMMIGKPIDVETQVPVQREERIFWSQADSLVGWTTAEKVDGSVAGSMESNGYLFQPVDYGAGTGWHGPAMKTSLSEVLTDFHVEAIVELYNGDPSMIGRVEIYLLDETGDIIGKIALKDVNVGSSTTYGEARIGDDIVNHHIIDETGQYPWTWNNFYGILRFGRHAGTWFAYIAKIDQATGKHHSRMYREFNDVNNQFTKNLAQIAVHFGQMGTYTPANVRIQDIKVYKWNAITQQEVPYIANIGDKITFDHITKDILINGESRKDLKDLGATFFKLYEGQNTLTVYPLSAFATKASYRERFK